MRLSSSFCCCWRHCCRWHAQLVAGVKDDYSWWWWWWWPHPCNRRLQSTIGNTDQFLDEDGSIQSNTFTVLHSGLRSCAMSRVEWQHFRPHNGWPEEYKYICIQTDRQFIETDEAALHENVCVHRLSGSWLEKVFQYCTTKFTNNNIKWRQIERESGYH